MGNGCKLKCRCIEWHPHLVTHHTPRIKLLNLHLHWSILWHYLEKIPIVFGKYFISVNIHLLKKGYNIYSLREGNVILSIVIRSLLQYKVKKLSPLKDRCKNLPPPTPCDLHMFRFIIIFVSCFIMGEVHKWGTFPKCINGQGHCFILGPLISRMPSPWGFTI
jgi:hypothetical protein